MTKEVFLKELREDLENYEVNDIDEIIAYFDEMIEDKKDNGMDEEVIIDSLDSPKEIALVLKGKEAKEEEIREGEYEMCDGRVRYTKEATDLLSISIDIADDEIKVTRGDDDNLYVIFEEKENDHYKIKEKDRGSKLKIEKNTPPIFNIFNSKERALLELILPSGYSGELKIETVSGNIEGSDLKLRKLRVETVSGDVVIENCDIEDLKVQAVSGDIEVKDVRAVSLKVDNVSGDSEVDVKADFIKTESVSGDLTIDIKGEEKDYAIYYDKLMKDYKLRTELKDQKHLKMESVSGTIDYHFTA